MGACFQQGNTYSGSYQSIYRLSTMPSSFIFHPDSDSLCSCSWLRIGCWEDLARKNMVRNRDTGFGLIETSQTVYIEQCIENKYKKLLHQSRCATVQGAPPRGLRAAVKQQITRQKQTDVKMKYSTRYPASMCRLRYVLPPTRFLEDSGYISLMI